MSTLTETRKAVTHTVGTFTEGDYINRVIITAQLEHHEGADTTVDHQPISERLRFTVSGVVEERRAAGGRWKEISGGQCIGALRRVTSFKSGWDAGRASGAIALWERWHLNDLTAACAHQRPVRSGRYLTVPTASGGQLDIAQLGNYSNVNAGDLSATDVNLRLVCGETGYRYGTAWLVDPLPAAVLAQIYDVYGLTAP